MARSDDLICLKPAGLYCPGGDFYIDPWRPVERAVITHAHRDHARSGHAHYLAAVSCAPVLRSRLGGISLQTAEYGATVEMSGTRVSLHPAGHVLGSAQVRIEHRGRVWVASGDYQDEGDPTCAPFEPVRCDAFITESTFGLPIYRWPASADVFDDIHRWWSGNAAAGHASVLFCYAFGKAQRILAGIDPSIGPLLVHGAMEPLNRAYRASGVKLPATRLATEVTDKNELGCALVLAPPSAQGTPWLKRFGEYSAAFASGWMRLRGTRRRRALDRGFVLSDHADWPGLMQAIGATSAQRVMVTHGQVPVMVRWLREQGLDAEALATEFGDDSAEEAAEGVNPDGPAPAAEAPG